MRETVMLLVCVALIFCILTIISGLLQNEVLVNVLLFITIFILFITVVLIMIGMILL